MRARGSPTLTIRPGAARIFTTVPVTGEGISTFALSVRISTSGSSSLTAAPSATSQRTTSPSAIPSPTSGNFSSRHGQRSPFRTQSRLWEMIFRNPHQEMRNARRHMLLPLPGSAGNERDQTGLHEFRRDLKIPLGIQRQQRADIFRKTRIGELFVQVHLE